ncbi:MAG: peroxiredoxin [Bryobacterales bacterium]|nr:peroxiredoxin [Bryobacterales bacterium]
MPELKEGSKAPDFTLATDTGDSLKLSSLAGNNVVLYFYPKADTPGCTKEACSFRDESPRLGAADAVVLGASPDPVSAVAKFKAKYNLPLSPRGRRTQGRREIRRLGRKTNYGKTYMGVARTTFIIGKDGRIAKIFPKVKVDGHTEEVLAALAAL